MIILVVFACTIAVLTVMFRMHTEEREHFRTLMSMLAVTEGSVSMISPEVQALMDQAKAATQIAPALDAGFKALGAQIDTLTKTLSSSTSMTADEKAAVTQLANDLKSSITTLQTDIPANVAPTPIPAGPTA